jgi:hypothetical protein
VPAVSTFSPTSDPLLNGVLSGVKWATGSLTFSFPSAGSLYSTGTYGSGEPTTGFEAFNAVQETAARSVLKMYASVANVTFTEVTETSSVHGDLRYAESDAPSTAWAYYPSTSPLGGDIWLNNSKNWYDNPLVGTYGYQTLLHETGHAMGLKHPQDAKGAFATMPLDHDSIEYTVMSYPLVYRCTADGLHRGSNQLPADAYDVRHRGAPADVRCELQHERRQHHVQVGRCDRTDVAQRRGAGRTCRQQDLHDDLGRRRRRHL